MTPTPDLKPLSDAELTRLNAWLAADLPDGLSTAERLSRLRKIQRDERVLGIHHQGQLVAAAVVDWATDPVHLESIVVNRAHRRQQWGRSLLNALLARSHAMGAHGIRLTVRRSQAATIAFYTALNAQPGRVRPQYYPDDDGLEMWIASHPTAR